MPGQMHTFKFEKEFDFKGTADLTPSLDVKLECQFPLEGVEISVAKKIEKSFAQEFDKLIKGQMAHFEKWLKEKQKNIDDAKALAASIEKMGVPKNEGEAKKIGAALNKLDGMKFVIDDLKKDFREISENWAKGVVDRQSDIAIQTARKKAGAKLLKDKKTRLVLGKVVKGVLLVSALAVSVAAIVLSAGAAAPLVLALGIATASLGGGAGIYGFVKTVTRDNDVEKKALKNVEGELAKIASAMAPIASSPLGKHVLELENIVKQRKSELQKLKMELKKTIVLIESQDKAVTEIARDNTLSLKEFGKSLKKLAKLKSEGTDIMGKIEKASSVASQGEELIKDLKAFDTKIDEFGKFYKSSSIGGNLKKYFTSAAGYADLAKSLAAFRPGAGLVG